VNVDALENKFRIGEYMLKLLFSASKRLKDVEETRRRDVRLCVM